MLEALPLVFALAGLAFYIILAGADFGAALWQVSAPPTPAGRRLRDFAHNVMAPVWEANHVWLIFVLTVTWTAYPGAFGSIASTLAIPLLLAALGIVVRGAAYAFGTRDADRLSAVASVLTPFTLAACVGGIASGRVPYGNARGDLWSSWLNPTSLVLGALAVAISAYLCAVYLCADARRRGAGDLIAPLRRRALGAGVVAGAVAAGGLVVVRLDARPLFDDLVSGAALAVVLASGAAGLSALVLVARHRFAFARYAAALAVAMVLAAWALAQSPLLLPGLTVSDAAAPHATLWAIVVAVLGGGAVLAPALLVLLRLSLEGRLGYDDAPAPAPPRAAAEGRAADGPSADGRAPGRAALACVGGALLFLTVLEAGWAHALGVVCVLLALALGAAALTPQAARAAARPPAAAASSRSSRRR
jgi:cytochrome d ubiquinol oxidase subunit II